MVSKLSTVHSLSCLREGNVTANHCENGAMQSENVTLHSRYRRVGSSQVVQKGTTLASRHSCTQASRARTKEDGEGRRVELLHSYSNCRRINMSTLSIVLCFSALNHTEDETQKRDETSIQYNTIRPACRYTTT